MRCLKLLLINISFITISVNSFSTRQLFDNLFGNLHFFSIKGDDSNNPKIQQNSIFVTPGFNAINRPSEDIDTIPQQGDGQVFNTTGGNGEPNNYVIENVESTSADGNDSTSARHEAQDYNSSRSNRANSIVIHYLK